MKKWRKWYAFYFVIGTILCLVGIQRLNKVVAQAEQLGRDITAVERQVAPVVAQPAPALPESVKPAAQVKKAEAPVPAQMYAPSCIPDNIPFTGRDMKLAIDANYRRVYPGLRVSWQYYDQKKPIPLEAICLTIGETYRLPFGSVTILPPSRPK